MQGRGFRVLAVDEARSYLIAVERRSATTTPVSSIPPTTRAPPSVPRPRRARRYASIFCAFNGACSYLRRRRPTALNRIYLICLALLRSAWRSHKTSEAATTKGTTATSQESCNMSEIEENMSQLALTVNSGSENGEGSGEQSQGHEKESAEAGKEVKKRKAMAPRSEAWLSFTKIKEKDSDVVKEAMCNYCKTTIKCDSKTNGTSALGKHLRIFKKNPNKVNDAKQPVLQATAASNDVSKSSITAWRFDPEILRDAFSEMIITDELPFAFSEKSGFRKFMSKACPRFTVPSRRTTTRDVVTNYNREKEKLKKFFKKSCERVCLTTDTWTSSQQQSYMCVTAHFIDECWELHKRIIGFFMVKGHKVDDIGKDIERCLVEWGLDKVFTITVDNASANDGAVSYIAKITNKSKTSILQAKLLHMRCAAHIVNLIVHDGLKELDSSVKRVRAAVRFIKSSPTRIAKFKKCAELEKVTTKAFLSLDVVTRWNSTYKMLNAAVAYEKVFERYAEDDPYYIHDLSADKQPGVPDYSDWANAAKMAEFLEHFHRLTLRVSVTLHPTSHIFFHEVADLNILLRSWCESSDYLRKEMAKRMLAKYNKYWGDHTCFNILIFVAVALDPQYKLSNYTKIATLEMFGEVKGEDVWNEMTKTLTDMFEEYQKKYAPCEDETQSNEAKKPQEEEGTSLMRSLIAKRMKMSNCGVTSSKSELEKYLAEESEPQTNKFDILGWWKVNSSRFPMLSRLARDVLAIPISTVASESTFSTGGRILDDFRSSLTPFMVEALICTQDWMRRANPAITDEENTEELVKLEEELFAEMGGLNISDSGAKNSTNEKD